MEKVCGPERVKRTVSNERTQSRRNFQIVGSAHSAVWKEQNLKIRLELRTCKKLEEKDDLRTREGR